MTHRKLTIASIAFALLVAVVVGGYSTSSKSLVPAVGEDLSLWANIQNNSLDGLMWTEGTGEATSLFELLVPISNLATQLSTCDDKGPWSTVFVPGDKSLSGLVEGSLTFAKLQSNPALTRAILYDHIVDQAVSPPQLLNPYVTILITRSGFRLAITRTSDAEINETAVTGDVSVGGVRIVDVQEACNGYLYGIDGLIDSSVAETFGPAVDPPAPLTATWTSPPTPTSSRHLVYELDFSRTVFSGLTSSNFVNTGNAPGCTFTPKADTPDLPTTKFYVVVSCANTGTVWPRLLASTLEVSDGISSTQDADISATTAPSFVHILNGIVLTINKTGAGQGTVSSNISGVNCGVLCVGSFRSRTRITLSYTPAAGSAFAGWSGACSGSGSCPLTLTSSAAVVARFEPVTQILVYGVGDGSGTVTSNLPGVNCPVSGGSMCEGWVASNTAITLQARPNRGFRFLGWMGACVGTGPCSVVTNPAGEVMNVFAAFGR